jgi:hypothetical protein
MNYDAFIYVLLRTAADNDGSFRTAFLADPAGVLGNAHHEFRSSYLGDEDLTLPTQAEARALLADYLPDYDGTKGARMNVRFNWTWPQNGSS